MNGIKKNDIWRRPEQFIVNLLSKIGIPSTIIVVLMLKASDDQYRQFIDIYILLKFPRNSVFLPLFVLICIVLVSVGTIFYFRIRLKIKDERIQLLEKDLRELQTTVLKNKAPKKTGKKV